MFIKKKILSDILRRLSLLEKEQDKLKRKNEALSIANKYLNHLHHDNKLIVENIGSNQLKALVHSGLLKGDYGI